MSARLAWAYETTSPHMIGRLLVYPNVSRRQLQSDGFKIYAEKVCGPKPRIRRVRIEVIK